MCRQLCIAYLSRAVRVVECLRMSSPSLLDLPPELIHTVALNTWLSPSDVAALSQTCRRLAAILVHDPYGNNMHHALLGVLANTKAKRWKAASYAASRAWYGAGEGETALKHAAEQGIPELVRLLVQRGVDVDAVDGIGDTALIAASGRGHADVVRILVEEGGADVEIVGWAGETPLYAACQDGWADVVELLLAAGADVAREVGDEGETALDVAHDEGWDDIVLMLRHHQPPSSR